MVETSKDYKVAIIGYGWVGRAYHKMFPNAVIYDEPQKLLKLGSDAFDTMASRPPLGMNDVEWDVDSARATVNKCDLALICVPTDLRVKVNSKDEVIANQGVIDPSNCKFELDMSIVDEVVGWLETPLILIKSALQPGTVDSLVKSTGKRIAVSVEMVGEGKYYVPDWKYPHPEDPTKHNFLIVGGDDETARRCADFLWAKMSPDINIHLTTAKEAEITKLMENFWGAQKVTFANVMYDICQQEGANYTKVLQAWGSDGRTEKMHMRVVPHKRGWKSKCFDKDVPALASLDMSGFVESVIKANERHLKENG